MASTFMRFPLEVRDMVYELCLVYPEELIPFPAFYERDEASPKPWNALLFVDKTISNEAAAVFYGKNTWRLSDSVGQIPRKSNDGKGPPELWKAHLKSMRHITIALDGRAFQPIDMWVSAREDFIDGGYKQTDEERSLDVHRELQARLELNWARKLRALRKMKGRLRSLRVDLENAYCPTAHCRPIEGVIDLLNEYVPYPKNRLSFYVTVTGMVTEEEAHQAHEAGYLCEDCHDGNDEDEDSSCIRALPRSEYY